MNNIQYYIILILFFYIPLYSMELPRKSSTNTTKIRDMKLDEITKLQDLIAQKEKEIAVLDNPDNEVEVNKIKEEIKSLNQQLWDKRFLYMDEQHMRAMIRP